jgi:two-component system CitB family response regulator
MALADILQVLIIEDDPRIAEINRKFVQKVPGYKVIGIALNEEEAKEQLTILEPDLVLLDIYFPGGNGLDILAYISQHYPQMDVIMITAANDVETVRSALKHGAYDFIIKPIVFDRFKETLTKYLDFRENLNILKMHKQQVEQEDIDQLIKREMKQEDRNEIYPKGIDKLTLEKVLAVINAEFKGFSAVQMGEAIGISRTTARRYLEYLLSIRKITADLIYGEIGRPERIYRRL